MWSRIFLLLQVILLLTGCNSATSPIPNRLIIGVVSYGESAHSLEKYSELRNLLAERLNSIVELEPTYNEIKAIDQIERQRWDVVFAPSGLTALALADQQYVPIFPLDDGQNAESVIVVHRDSTFTELSELSGKVMALSQPGSATGYYVPIYNLYGLTLTEVRFAPTPRMLLQWLAGKEVDAGAMSLDRFEQESKNFAYQPFKILYKDDHPIPGGAVLLASKLDEQEKKQIAETLASLPPELIQSAGYNPKAQLPKYDYLIEVVDRVEPIAERIKEKPAPLYEINHTLPLEQEE